MKSPKEVLELISPNRPWEKGGKTDQMIIKCMVVFGNNFVDELHERRNEWIAFNRDTSTSIEDKVMSLAVLTELTSLIYSFT